MFLKNSKKKGVRLTSPSTLIDDLVYKNLKKSRTNLFLVINKRTYNIDLYHYL